MKIEKLTPKQEQRMIEVKNEWLDLFFSGKEINKPKAKKLIEWLYEFSNLSKPKVVFVDSPLAAQIYVNQVEDQVRNQVGNQVWNQVRNQVRIQVEDQVRIQVEDQVRNQVRIQVRIQAEDQVRNQVRIQVRIQAEDQVRNQVWNQVRIQVGIFYEFSSYGYYTDFGWLAFYSFFEQEFGINKDHENFLKFRELMQCGIYDMIQLGGLCVVCSLPSVVRRDEKTRMHSEAHPAIEWQDGFKLWYLNGINFNQELWQSIVSKTLKAKDAIKLENQEQRTIALQYLGFEKLKEECNATKRSEDEHGELWELDLKDGNDRNYLYYRAIDPSKNEYIYLRTHPDVKTPQEAMTRAYKLERLNINYEPLLRT